MNKAKSIKANIAAKDIYDSALESFNRAESSPASAAGAYHEAERGFLAAYDQANAQREEALRQLNLAKTAIKDVEDEAAEIDGQQSAVQGAAP
jgi:hypothetical protein